MARAGPPERSLEEAKRTAALTEEAALEQRHWVRISYGCNNRCAFCLDSDLFRQQRFVPPDEVRARIDEGLREGATRLILSGGEATIHPAFVDLVRYGREAGYARVQTITNGRMLAYRRFLQDAVAAGLGEVTFSLHSHRQEVFERLTGVPGSFDQALTGLRRALATPGLIVSVDIVINRLNADELDQTVAWFADLGVGEFDLLHLVPFGRAFSLERGDVPLAVAPAQLRAPLSRTFALGRERGLVIWTNRLPPALLEGDEHLIQDPHKLADEVKGREQHITRLVTEGEPLRCRDQRCDVCYLTAYCEALHRLQARVAARNLPNLLITLTPGASAPDVGRFRRRLRRLWLRAPDLETLRAFPAPGVPEVWEITGARPLRGAALRSAVGAADRIVTRLVLQRVSALEPAVAAGVVAVELVVDQEGVAWLHARRDRLPAGLAVRLRVPQRLSRVVSEVPPLTDPRLADLAHRGVRLLGLPPCLGGPRVDRRHVGFVDLGLVDPQGRLDPDRHVETFIRHDYRLHSLRCDACRDRPRCRGLHVNLVRAQGFGVLTPR